MSKKSGNIFVQFIDKIILAASGLICILLLFTHILGGPNVVKYQGRKFGPGQIDSYILNEKATILEGRLATAPEKDEKYEHKTVAFDSKLKQSIENVNPIAYFPLPWHYGGKTETQDRVYRIPRINEIENISAALVKMVAYVPVEELSTKLTYAEAETKLQDLDFVTVEGQINLADLYDRFRNSFAGTDMSAEIRKEQYAKPVFAEVELQRQEMLQSGNWSDWQDIPKTKICHLKDILDIPDDINELDYGIEFNLAQFAKVDLRNEILQPGVYDDALATMRWISSSFYLDRQKKLEKEEQERERERLEAERLKRIKTSSDNRNVRRSRTTTAKRKQTPTDFGGGDLLGPGGMPMSPAKRPTQKTTRPAPRREDSRVLPSRKPTSDRTKEEDDITEEEKFEEIRLTDEDDVSEMEKFVFWAHDDTTEPKRQYRYRIRIGVFNPIAGKNWFSDNQKQLQNQVVLWSQFSDETEIIETPSRLAIFPTAIREVDKSVTVQISKYHLGRWHSEKFNIRPGEIIGKTVINASAGDNNISSIELELKEIDYSTGAVYIDAVKVNEWLGARVLRLKNYYKMLYTYQGDEIEHLPIKSQFWLESLATLFREIKKAKEAQANQIFELQPRGTIPTKRGRIERPSADPSFMDPGKMPPMMDLMNPGNLMEMPRR
jgi:hypothetical protein